MKIRGVQIEQSVGVLQFLTCSLILPGGVRVQTLRSGLHRLCANLGRVTDARRRAQKN